MSDYIDTYEALELLQRECRPLLLRIMSSVEQFEAAVAQASARHDAFHREWRAFILEERALCHETVLPPPLRAGALPQTCANGFGSDVAREAAACSGPQLAPTNAGSESESCADGPEAYAAPLEPEPGTDNNNPIGGA
jgi:hypothetical protein